MKDYNLERFISAQESDYNIALNEIKHGRKKSHWIWYIFPQLRGLGYSYNSDFYGIEDVDEAKKYLAHPVLGARLQEITRALLELKENDANKIMGSPDDMKLHSCMTLFAYISGNDSIFHKAINKFFAGQQDYNTLQIINSFKPKPRILPENNNLSWDSRNWLNRLNDTAPDYRALNREVWQNTFAIVEANYYELSDDEKILLRSEDNPRKESKFYENEFTAKFEPLNIQPEIEVVPDDCLDVAHNWVNQGLEVCVLNLANRHNPGGGVVGGSAAQEEYLFHCSDYYKFLYIFADYAERYGLKRSKYQYPLDRSFGGIYSPGVIVFRENESRGYELIKSPWEVNFIAVAGMVNPEREIINGEEYIIPELVIGVKNKIRTIFRIACENKQRNLVLGALGCGAFHCPPRHVAQLFGEVLRENEFKGAFNKICFAVKSHIDPEKSENYIIFREILDGFKIN
ncbi:MAG: TIGR02452 family protein [Synergistaceae bacterium]|nr:TIGR02452 family protein [Synergistaceae bacterium]